MIRMAAFLMLTFAAACTIYIGDGHDEDPIPDDPTPGAPEENIDAGRPEPPPPDCRPLPPPSVDAPVDTPPSPDAGRPGYPG